MTEQVTTGPVNAGADDHERVTEHRGKSNTGLYVGHRPVWYMEAIKVVVLVICCLAVIGPFVMVVATSFADPVQIGRSGGLVLWPENPTLEAYQVIFAGGQVTQALGVSGFVTIVGTMLSLLLTSLLAYALSRTQMLFSKFLLMGVLLTMLFSAGMIPLYLTVKSFNLLDSVWSLIIPTSVSAFNVIVMRQFFQNLPAELTEAASIDGASELRIYWSIILPLSKPIMAAIGLFYAVAYWNTFFSALLYINDTEKWPIQLVLRQYLVNNQQVSVEMAGEIPPPQPALQMAILVIALIPIACVYPFLQKHFTKGVLTGAVKG